MKHEGVAILCWALHADKQIINSSFWSQLNMENNLCTHIKKETVSKGMFGNFGKLNSDLQFLKPWFTVPECVGLLMWSEIWPLEHDRQVISWLSDEACLAFAAYWKPRNSMFPMYGERSVPILWILFLTPQKLCTHIILPYSFLTIHLPYIPCSNKPVCASAVDVT